jgi:hypothetical protein
VTGHDAIAGRRADTVPSRRRAMQSNLTQANEMLRIAHGLGVPDADTWAARVLACARSAGLATDTGPLAVARQVATASGRRLSAGEVRALAQAADAAHAGNASRLRDDAAARTTYNDPPHWIKTAEGRLVPDASRLKGYAAYEWEGLTTEFGTSLAQTLFDAHVRGGALAVIAAMNAAGSTKRLTASHLAALHFVALTDAGTGDLSGKTSPIPRTYHDATHAITGFGPSRFDEAQNNFAILSTNSDSAPFDLMRPMAQQPQRLTEFRNGAWQRLQALEFERIFQIALAADDLTGTPRQMAGEVARRLRAGGYLAHLDAQEHESLRSMLYGPSRVQLGGLTIYRDDAPPTLEVIAEQFERSGDRAGFDRELSAWSQRASDVLVAAAKRHRAPDADLEQSVARLLAFKICLARNTSPDLRVEFPRVLREVQQALGLPP